MGKKSLSLSLFKPGMTPLHRAGVAGLHMTLRRLEIRNDRPEGVHWRLEPTRIELTVDGKWEDLFSWLFPRAFRIDSDGLLIFAAHDGHPMGDDARVHLTTALYRTFLQHNKFNRIPGGTKDRVRSLEFDGKPVVVSYKPFVKPYAHATASAYFKLDGEGDLRRAYPIKSWLFPGAAERHSGLTGTEIEEPADRLLALLFAPTACLYYNLCQRGGDGRNRWGTAVVIPDVSELDLYSRCYRHFLEAPVKSLYTSSLGDAGLSALIALKGKQDTSVLGVRAIDVVTIGKVPWNTKTVVKNGALRLSSLRKGLLDQFALAWGSFENVVIVNDDERFLVFPSLCRGLVADNVAQGKEWFYGFYKIMASKKLASTATSEKEGLSMMIQNASWSFDRDAHFVRAVHQAIRSRYRALAERCRAKGERIPFDREFERMRTGLARAKNAHTLRAELADLFARGGGNKDLQKNWEEILPIFSGPDWQKARDLALLALASYASKEASELVIDADGTQEDDEEDKA